jgi:hypothetical protein
MTDGVHFNTIVDSACLCHWDHARVLCTSYDNDERLMSLQVHRYAVAAYHCAGLHTLYLHTNRFFWLCHQAYMLHSSWGLVCCACVYHVC